MLGNTCKICKAILTPQEKKTFGKSIDIFDDEDNQRYFIVPICDSCNARYKKNEKFEWYQWPELHAVILERKKMRQSKA